MVNLVAKIALPRCVNNDNFIRKHIVKKSPIFMIITA